MSGEFEPAEAGEGTTIDNMYVPMTDDQFIVFDKPAPGMAVQCECGTHVLINDAIAWIRDRMKEDDDSLNSSEEHSRE